ncbi:MAG: hypothetical protein WC322_01765 [Candidatus Paceibacterota bacterium]|jgi:hypothetical protein|nr:hypothetical protein [Candidatus Paceibacterota bacterium]MDD4830595.1 hypothetical protein [Candidatus Paceibacterota bacterium]MDD4874970.1 hypothetical protein [Candidatus Paceibacterota bacterium]
MFKKLNLERGVALLMGYASADLECWTVAILFGRPRSDFLFKIVDNDFKEKIIEEYAGQIEEVTIVFVELRWFWMNFFSPENIKSDFKEALCQAMVELEIQNEEELVGRKKIIEKKTEQRIKEKMGKKSAVHVKLNIYIKNKKALRSPNLVLGAA